MASTISHLPAFCSTLVFLLLLNALIPFHRVSAGPGLPVPHPPHSSSASDHQAMPASNPLPSAPLFDHQAMPASNRPHSSSASDHHAMPASHPLHSGSTSDHQAMPASHSPHSGSASDGKITTMGTQRTPILCESEKPTQQKPMSRKQLGV